MKIRTSFVSNSSTTSFIISGFKLDTTNLLKLYEKVTGKKLSEDDDYDIYCLIYEMSKVMGENIVYENFGYEYADNESTIVGYGDNIGDSLNCIPHEAMIENIEKAKKLKEKYDIEEECELWYGSKTDY